MKRYFAGPLLAASLALSGFGPAQAATELTIAHNLSPSSHYSAGAKAMAADLAERSGGKFKLVESYGGSLGGERELTEGTQIGTIDLVITSTGPIGNFVPDTLILDIPFLFSSYDQAHAVLDGPIGQALLEKFPEHGLKALAWTENGFRNLTNNVRPVKEPADVVGLKVRTMENDIHMEAFRTLGMLPTPMAFTELFTALEQGTVDGQENPIGVILSANFADVQKYLSLTQHVYSPAIILISPAVWNDLSEEEQGWFVESAKVGSAAVRKKVREDADNGVAILRDKGMQVVDQVDTAAFQEALKPAFDKFSEQFGKENIEAIRDYKP
ncbi:TRAP transporter substrate-binding protein [Castellaniella sp.]|uniref:TRAP transporter substrate-binding protein n=1 Tax=Castellaniella sp. TaxID=1955812 RepID=UPI00355E3823